MSKLIIHCTRAKNFRSVGNSWEEINFEESPDTMVGSEDNGQGKSTILVHATFYALFDKAYGDSDKKTSLINSTNRKELLVETELTAKGKRYLVRRGQKPTVFDIEVQAEDGSFVTIDQEAGLEDHQTILSEITGLDVTAFCNSIALGVDKFKPFIMMKTAERRPFVERILGLEIFTKLADRAKDRMKGNTKTLSDMEYDIKLKEGQLNSKTEILALREQGAADKLQTVKGEIAKCDEELNVENPKRDELSQKATLVDNRIGEVKQQQMAAVTSLRGEQDDEIAQLASKHQTDVMGAEADFRSTIGPKQASYDDKLAEFDAGQKDELDEFKAEQMIHIQKAGGTQIKADIDNAAVAIEEAEEASKVAYGSFQTFDTDLQQLRGKVDEVTQDTRTVIRDRDRIQKGIDEIYAQGTCPSCTQDIPDALKDETSANARSQVADLNTKIDDLQSDGEELSKSFDDMQAKWNASEAEYSQSTATLESARETHATLVQTLTDAVSTAKDLARDNVNEKIQEQANARVTFITDTRSEIDALQATFDRSVSSMKVDQAGELSDLKIGHSKTMSELESEQQDAMSKLTNVKSVVSANLTAANETVARITSARNGYIDDLTKLEAEAEFDFDGAKAEINDLESEVAVLNGEFEQLAEQQDLLKVLSGQILTDKGIKASILDKYLPFINQRVNMYLNSMNVYLNLEMDTAYNVTMNAPDRRGQTVYSLSNGQKARLNCAFMLAWRDVADMRSSTSCNLLVLDETLENISENGVKEAIDLVKQASKGKNLFVITQRNSEFEEHFSNTITYTLKDGYTKRI